MRRRSCQRLAALKTVIEVTLLPYLSSADSIIDTGDLLPDDDLIFRMHRRLFTTQTWTILGAMRRSVNKSEVP